MMRLEELKFDFFTVSEIIKLKVEPVSLGFASYLYRNYFRNWEASFNVAIKLNDFFIFLDKKVRTINTAYLHRGMLDVEIEREYWLDWKDQEKIRGKRKLWLKMIRRDHLDVPGIILETVDKIMPILNYKIYIDKLAE